jgi:antitoxin component YwqK of YwqJK toxin-antitoxin module
MKLILSLFLLFCVSCAGVSPNSSPVTAADFDRAGCDYVFDSLAEARAAIPNVADEYMGYDHYEITDSATGEPVSGMVCIVDNGTYSQTPYEKGYMKDGQRVYDANGTILTEAYGYSHKSINIFTADGYLFATLTYYKGMLTEGVCAGGRELDSSELIAYIRSEELACVARPAMPRRNLSASACQYAQSDVEIGEDKLIVSKITGKPVDGTVCVLLQEGKQPHPYGYMWNIYIAAQFKNGRKDGIDRRFTYEGEYVTMSERIYVDGRLTRRTAYEYKISDHNARITKLTDTPYKTADVEDGVELIYEDGILRMEISYKDGKRDGWLKRFNADGQLDQQILYKDDIAISGNCGNGEPLTDADLKSHRFKKCESK